LNNTESNTVSKLTALWALSESGLGGMMHALKIPFTGFFLGGFAIVIITLIAQLSEQKFKTIIQATVLVILVKATASPHSPPMAYIAVAFQGFVGAVVFQMIPFIRFAAILFGGLALLESAVQKFIVATLIFGKSIWEALDTFVLSVLKDLSLFYDFSFSFWLIVIYTGIYVVWGMILGAWAATLLSFLQYKKSTIMEQYIGLMAIQTLPNKPLTAKRNRKIALTVLVVLGMVSVFLWQGSNNKALYAIARTLAALVLLFYVLTPIVSWAMQKWVKNKMDSTAFTSLLETLPELRNDIAPALQMAKQSHKGLAVYKAFVENIIILTLYK
jgi:hypothetical protein